MLEVQHGIYFVNRWTSNRAVTWSLSVLYVMNYINLDETFYVEKFTFAIRRGLECIAPTILL